METDFAFFQPLHEQDVEDGALDRIVDEIEDDPDLVAEARALAPWATHNHAVARMAADLYDNRRRHWRGEP